MEWHNGAQIPHQGSNVPASNGQWFNNAPYSNYPPFSCPPPANGFNGPPPNWGSYPQPYGSYSYPANNWTYAVPPPSHASSVSSPSQPEPKMTDENKQNDSSKVNPPLPPDPPPTEPPLPPPKESEDKDQSLKVGGGDSSKPPLPPMFIIDPKAPPPPPPPSSGNSQQSHLAKAMNYHQRFQGGNWYSNDMYMNQKMDRTNCNNNVSNSQSNQDSSGLQSNNSKQNPVKFNIFNNQNLNTYKNRFEHNNPSQSNFNNSNNNYGQTSTTQNNYFNDFKSNNAQENVENSSTKGSSDESSSNIMANKDWPESLKSYVGKCFARCVTEIDKDQVEICLKGKLTLAAKNRSLWDKNWDQEPLIGVYSSVNSSNGKKSSFPTKNANKTPTKKGEGDPSRGFYITKRSSSSRSKSRSNSPDIRRRRERRYSSESEDRGFISFRGSRGGAKNKKKSKKNAFNNNKNGAFYTKSGMTLKPELCTSDRLNKRAARFGDAQRGLKTNNAAQNKRRKVAMNISASINTAFSIDSNADNFDWSSIHITGTSTALEKQYLRLTSAPDASTVRTAATLKKSLEHVKRLWKEKHNYKFACDQLKAIRQDLTVQGIRNEFTREVYETHCRVALEKGDHEEFNQCQTQLKDLYSQIGGSHQSEFIAYRLLYYIFTSNTLDMTSMLASLSETDKNDSCVSFALKLRAAGALNNYYQFFKLYRNAPKMTGFLVDWFIERERKKAIKIMVKSYRPGNLDVEFVKSTLAFSDEDWVKFVETVGLVCSGATKNVINCKSSATAMGL